MKIIHNVMLVYKVQDDRYCLLTMNHNESSCITIDIPTAATIRDKNCIDSDYKKEINEFY